MHVRRTRPLTRPVVGWAIAFTISIVVFLAGGGVVLWSTSSDSGTSAATSFGATLVALGGMGAVLTGVAAWLVSGRSRRGP